MADGVSAASVTGIDIEEALNGTAASSPSTLSIDDDWSSTNGKWASAVVRIPGVGIGEDDALIPANKSVNFVRGRDVLDLVSEGDNDVEATWITEADLPPEYVHLATKGEDAQAKLAEVAAAHRQLQSDAHRMSEKLAEYRGLVSRLSDELRSARRKQKEILRDARKKEAASEKRMKEVERRCRAEVAELRAQQEIYARKQLEKKEKKRRAELRGDAEDIVLDFSGEDEGSLMREIRRMKRLLMYVMWKVLPLRHNVVYVEARFGEGVAVYFHFFQWMILTNLVLAVFVLCFFYTRHWILVASEGIEAPSPALPTTTMTASLVDASEKTENTIVAFGWEHSSVRMSEAGPFAVTMLVALLWYGLGFIYKFLSEAKTSRLRELEDVHNHDVRYSKVCLNSLDFTVFTARDADSMKHSTAASLKTLLDEDAIDTNVPLTPALVLRRLVSGVIQLLLIAVTWSALLALKVHEHTIVNTVSVRGTARSLAQLVPSACITLLTMLLPQAIKALTAFERWSSPETMLVLQVLRLYAVKIVTVVILLLQAYEELTGSVLMSHIGQAVGLTSSTSQAGRQTDPCPQDKVGQDLLLLMITTSLGKAVGSLLSVTSLRVLYGPSAKGDFEAAPNTIDALYFQALVWTCFPFTPFAVPFGVLLMLATFKLEVFVLTNYLKRPSQLWGVREVTSWFLALYILTLLLAISSYYFLWMVFDTSKCGAFRDEPLLQWVQRELIEWPPGRIAVRVVLNPVVLSVIAGLAFVGSAKKGFRNEALQEHLVGQQDRQRVEADSYQKQLAQLRMQIDKLRAVGAIDET